MFVYTIGNVLILQSRFCRSTTIENKSYIDYYESNYFILFFASTRSLPLYLSYMNLILSKLPRKFLHSLVQLFDEANCCHVTT